MTKAAGTEQRREALGSVFRSVTASLEAKGLIQKIRSGLPAETQKLLDTPPGRLTWIPATHLDQLYLQVAKFEGEETLRNLGYELSKDSVAVVKPVVQMALTLFGRDPSGIFSNLDRFWTVATRGYSFGWEPTSPRSGMIVCRMAPPASEPIILAVLEGNLRYVYELCGVEGRVEGRVVSEEGAVVRLKAAW